MRTAVLMRRLLVVLLSLTLVATGCASRQSPSEPDTQPPSPQETPSSSEPEQPAETGLTMGGRLIIGRPSDSVTLDPNDSPDVESTSVTGVLVESLVRFKPGTLEIEPWLATDWDVSPDGLVWTFHLRDGVRFHDGTPFNAEAVEFTFSRILDEDNPYHQYGKWTHASSQYNTVTEVKAIDNLTVEMTLSEPFSPLLTALASPRGGIVSPRAVKQDPENFFKNPVATGPYKLKEWRPDDRVVLERFTDYWGEPGRVDEIIFRVIPETAARMLALAQGDIHVMTSVDRTAAEAIKQNESLVLQESPGLMHTYLVANHLKPPLDNVKVRKAIFHAINREALVKAFWEGATVAKGVMSPFMLGFHDGLAWPEYDPENARQLLTEAGFPNGFKTSLMTYNAGRTHTPEPRKAAEAIQADLAKVGIDVEIILIEAGTLIPMLRAAEHELHLAGFNPLIPDPWTIMYTQFDSRRAVEGSAQNFAFYRNPDVDALNDKATRTANQDERVEAYRNLQEILLRDVARIDIADVNTLVGLRQEVQEFMPDFQSSFYLQYTWLKK